MKNEKQVKQKGFAASLARFLTHERFSGFTVSLFCIVLMLIVSSVFLLILGKNPLTAFMSFLASDLSPIFSIISADGPINVMSFSAQALAKSGFSARRP